MLDYFRRWRGDERDNNDDGPDYNDGNVYKGDHGELLNDGNDENNLDNDHDSPENNSGGGDDDDNEDDDKDPDVNIDDEDEPDCESSAKKTW